MCAKLSSRYLGFELKNPLVAAASPLTGKLDLLKKLEDNSIAAVVLPSLFEEQITHEESEIAQLRDSGTHAFAEAIGGYFPDLKNYNTGPDSYLELVRTAKESLSIPVIGSLNGTTLGGWTEHARLIQEAGADALELNIYLIPADATVSGVEIEGRYVDLVAQVQKSVTIPVAVKVSPFFSAPAHMARRLVEAGAKGLVLFNRFYQPDIDLETLAVKPNLELSTSAELRLPLRWMAILKGRVEASLAATSGVHSAPDVLKLLLAGADAVMLASVLLKEGPTRSKKLVEEMDAWLTEREYESVEQMKGSLSQAKSPDPVAFERANYMATLTTYTTKTSWY